METMRKNVKITTVHHGNTDVKTSICTDQHSDKKLYALCRKYGTQTLLWRQKFIGLLPEVNRRRLYEKKGFGSIFEFGKRIAGLSEAQIRLALNLEKRFSDKPELRKVLVEGKVSINKLARVVSVATVENEEVLVESARRLSKSSLDVLVKDVRRFQNKNSGVNYGDSCKNSIDFENQNGLFEGQIEVKSLPGQGAEAERRRFDKLLSEKLNDDKKKKLKLSEDTLNHLLELQEKGIDIDEIVRMGLKKRNEEITQEKAEIAKLEVEKKRVGESDREEGGKLKPGRYRNVRIQRVLEKEFGTKCAVPNCERDREHVHHTLPFAITGNNDPRFLIPLCKSHHDVVHVVNQKVWKYK